ncbi:protein FAM102A-like [Amblyraja radiata]|uniref:protein FAM102A-like n=1 Tax=Amblyraja radiata TaxID=386614 RepID=UPI0014038487|nr:protein FAM102A-like [Amblyraja radiata]XP_032872167.1 protein FAM102A-like [Amblyraja radiata]
MAFLSKKKKFKFLVRLTVVDLSAVPFVNGIIFCKLRLMQGGVFEELTSREEVLDNCVQWQKESCFKCKMSASSVTGVLDASVCRVSVRKELKGGKSFLKLGFVDLNLAEFAGCGSTARCCLLEGYDTKHTRQDNSILKVSISMQLLSGDPCFKTPHSTDKSIEILGHRNSLQPDCKGGDGTDEPELERERNRPDSWKHKGWFLPANARTLEGSDCTPEKVHPRKRHSRNSSGSSQLSKISGYSSEGSLCSSRSEPAHRRNGSGVSRLSSGIGSTADLRDGNGTSPDTAMAHPKLSFRSERLYRRKKEEAESRPTRLDDTRVSACDIVERIIREQDFSRPTGAEDSGLQLYVGRDGTVKLGGLQTENRLGNYKPVVIDSH